MDILMVGNFVFRINRENGETWLFKVGRAPSWEHVTEPNTIVVSAEPTVSIEPKTSGATVTYKYDGSDLKQYSKGAEPNVSLTTNMR